MQGENFKRIVRGQDIKTIKEKILLLETNAGNFTKNARKREFLTVQNTTIWQKKSNGKNTYYGGLKME